MALVDRVAHRLADEVRPDKVHEQLLAGVREVTFQRSLPLATRDLRTLPSELGDRAGIIGAAIMVIEHVLAPDVVDRVVQGGVATA